jgi:hypothetical protein
MEREILFKARIVGTKKWVEGSFVSKINFYEVGGLIENIIVYNGDCVSIDRSTLCEWTGKFGTDGNKIWENDILSRGEGISNVFVKYVDSEWVLLTILS